MEKVKLCIDCRHYRKGSVFHWCDRDVKAEYSLITGELLSKSGTHDAESERKHGWFDSRLLRECGKEGRYWEAK